MRHVEWFRLSFGGYDGLICATTEDRPIRILAVALTLTLTLLLSAAVTAHEPLDGSHWPTADELRRDLQDIGYEFSYDPAARSFSPEFRADLPALWSLIEPVVADDEMPDTVGYQPFTLQFVDAGDQPTQIVFTATSMDDGDGEVGAISTVLMEVAARLPDGNGIDAAVWYMNNLWLHPEGAEERTTLPCLVQEFDGGAMLVGSGRDGEGLTGVFGMVGPLASMASDIAACRAMQAEAGVAGEAAALEPFVLATDRTVTPDEAVAMIDAGDHTVIDVRTPAEFEAAHVVGALNIDVEAPDFADRIAELDPEGPYLVYCRSGRRSAIAAEQMTAAGIVDVADAGGLVDLARAGAPIE